MHATTAAADTTSIVCLSRVSYTSEAAIKEIASDQRTVLVAVRPLTFKRLVKYMQYCTTMEAGTGFLSK